ncbi:MAG: hypothetical protein ACREHD_17240 [Pirellulales bacterium]
MPYIIWLVIQAIQWAVTLLAAWIAVRVANGVIRLLWPVPLVKRRRDAWWLLAWLIMLGVATALVHCQVGDFFSFRDPAGNDWTFDAHGWPLSEPTALMDVANKNGAAAAIYLTAISADLACSLLLLMATRMVIDRWSNAWDAPQRWSTIGPEAAGWCFALVVVLACERLAARPINLPGTELIVYTTLVYERPEVRAGVLVGLASAAFCAGLAFLRGARAFNRLRDEGVI